MASRDYEDRERQGRWGESQQQQDRSQYERGQHERGQGYGGESRGSWGGQQGGWGSQGQQGQGYQRSGSEFGSQQSGGYGGRYFVLMGHLSPLDGVGPEQLGFDRLDALLGEGEIREVILATNPTVEGEATAHFIGEMVARRGIRATRIAHGVPVGGELEYVDGGTLAHALAGRQVIA